MVEMRHTENSRLDLGPTVQCVEVQSTTSEAQRCVERPTSDNFSRAFSPSLLFGSQILDPTYAAFKHGLAEKGSPYITSTDLLEWFVLEGDR